MSTLWDDIAKTIRDSVDTVVGKTEELTKIGRIKVDIINIKRNIEKQFTELGGTVFHMIDENKTSIASNADVKAIVEKVKELEKQLNAKNEELERVKAKEEAKTSKAEVVEVEDAKKSDKSKETEPTS